ncbi:hypothetical protein AGMMS49957_08150 [Synergistales bacterium]|nr:hypothetical protein AGMMS49957_08150 [Synergistales bacterium]
MLLGFGLLVVIFLAAILVAESRMSRVNKSSDYLSKEVAPVMEKTVTMERKFHNLEMAVRMMQYTSGEESVKAVKTALDELQKTLDDMASFGAAHPSLGTPKQVRDNIIPLYKSYSDLIAKSIEADAKEEELYQSMMRYAESMYSSASDSLTSLGEALDMALRVRKVEIPFRVTQYRNGAGVVSAIQNLLRNTQRSVAESDAALLNMALDEAGKVVGIILSTSRSLTDAKLKELTAKAADEAKTFQVALQDYIKAFTDAKNFDQSIVALLKQISDESITTSSISQAAVVEISEDNKDAIGKTMFVMFVSAVIAAVLGIIVSLLISHGISAPLNVIVNLAHRAGEGDLTITRSEFKCKDKKDELGLLANALSNMIEAQKTTLENVVKVAKELAEGTQNLSAISEETNASMEEIQASVSQATNLSESNSAALEESNAGVEEMSTGANTVAHSAADSASSISETTEISRKAISTVSSVIRGMRDVDKNSKETESKTRQLVASVDNVSSFVSVITGIADQTNLLALNAAIEAARAGEVGRGFAVVAEEVRKLAEESAKAAQNVNNIIAELQGGAAASIKATTEAGRLLAETLTQAELAQSELDETLKEINKANDSIQHIASVAEEQAASSKEIATAIDNATKSTAEMVGTLESIRSATDETAHTAQGVAKQSEAINEHVASLTAVLSKFKLKEASGKEPYKATGKRA